MRKYLPLIVLLGILISSTMNSFAQNSDPRMSSMSFLWDGKFYDVPPGHLEYKNPNHTNMIFRLSDVDANVEPNFRVHPSNLPQSEVPITRGSNPNILFASANIYVSSSGFFSEGVYVSTNGGSNWFGSDTCRSAPITDHVGDPGPGVGPDGRLYMSFLGYNGGMKATYSTDFGNTWSSSAILQSGSVDKNHTAVDNISGSPYLGRAYVTWSDFNESNPSATVSYTTNGGVNWSTYQHINTNASGHYSQGVNGAVSPNGTIYVTWQNPVAASPYTGDFIGLGKSTDGGVTWTYNNNIYDCNGIRGYLQFTGASQIRTNDFPWMAIDNTGGIRNGYMYIVTGERNLAPAGNDPDIVLHYSSDGGTTWSAGIRVNQDTFNNGQYQYMPAVTVGEDGAVNVVYYDTRNSNLTSTPDSAQVYVSRSIDGGLTFEDFLVSDHKFKPKPISGLAGGYQGDYIGIVESNGAIFPYWCDDVSGIYQAWTTKVTFGPSINHTPLENTENLIGPYVIDATVTSLNPLVPGSIKMYWGRGVGALTDSVVMTNTGGNNYTANIPGNGANAVYNYYLAATDDQGFRSTLPGGAPGNYFTFEAATDLVAPSITHTAIGSTPQLRWPIDISADVTDNIGVGTVECEFRVNGGSITTFPMSLSGGNTYTGTFTGTVAISDLLEYRIKATDISSQLNVGYNPASGYNSFTIIDVLGLVLVVDEDATLEDRISTEKEFHEAELSIPLGASATLFNTTLSTLGYLVEEVTWSTFNPATLNDYDLVILAAGLNESAMFDDQTKRTAITNWTLAGGKTIVEGGEVGYQYRKSGTTTDKDPLFRQNVLNDSAWISDRSGDNLVISLPTHPIFNTPNIISGTITVNNGGSAGWGARDEVTLLNKSGVIRIANWAAGTATNPGIIVYNPENDPDVARNIFFPFAIASFADQNVAADLIENAVTYLFRDIIPVELTAFNALVAGNNVNLNWSTATELNNSGFEIQRKSENSSWANAGFVAGFGTTTESKSYSFTDNNLAVGNYTYRLKQIDFNGGYEYSNEINVDVNAPLTYNLEQNYPNPFNPSTLIKYSVAKDGFVNVSIFNLLGEKVSTLVNSNMKAGSYELNFNASQLSSGVYFYSIEAGDFKAVRKMMLMK